MDGDPESYFLYPRIAKTRAEELATELESLEVEVARARSGPGHNDAVYAPSGGHRVTEDWLGKVADGVRSIAARSGYPDILKAGREDAYRTFDADTAVFLHSHMRMSAAEASVADVWAFAGCVLLPDIARWRYPGRDGTTTTERFLGAARGTRNVLGRLWWRAEILVPAGKRNDDQLLEFLSEDEIVAVMERPGLAGNRCLARQLCESFQEAVRSAPDLRRTDIMRDATKRVRRLLSVVSFEALCENQVRDIVTAAMVQSVLAMRTQSQNQG